MFFIFKSSSTPDHKYTVMWYYFIPTIVFGNTMQYIFENA